MWGSAIPPDRDNHRNPWHEDDYLRDGREEVVTPDNQSEEDSSDREGLKRAGTWGERDAGKLDTRAAAEDLEVLRGELASLSNSRSRGAQSQRSNPLSRTVSRVSGRQSQSHPRGSITRAEEGTGDAEDDEPGDIGAAAAPAEKEDDFELDEFMREGHFEKRKDGQSVKKVGVIYKNLTVKGVGSTASFARTLPDAILGTFGPDLYKIVTGFVPALKLGRHKQMRTLIHDFSGVVKDGEMMLVLGRPGSGCSTLLKAISNNRESYAAVEGDVSYGGIPAGKQKKQFRGEVNYNPEDDSHMADLNVWQTLKFALTNKTKKNEKHEIPIILEALLKVFGISHTKYTKVGDEYVRGVSGGERKRVSIAETLATKSSVNCWDNSTRGLDASTALDYAKSLRIMTDISNRTTLVTLYQAGEQIYEVMDKVMVIDAGRCIYQGPANEAKQYFEDLGFKCPERQTTADFLTAVTDPTERQFRSGFEDKAPKTSEELERAFRESDAYKKVLREISEYEAELEASGYVDAKEFEGAVRESKSKTVRKKSPYTVSFIRQVIACTQREFWLTWGDQTTLYTKFFIIISNGLIVGSLFYGQSLDTSGAFSRGGSGFFSILFLGWLQLSELMKAVSGRNVVKRHEDYAFYRPSAVAIARVVQDFPLLLAQVIPFSIIMYFMTGLDVDVSKFFIYFLFIYTTTFCITSLYRMFAALSPTIDDAVRFAGIALNLLIIYTGYVIPKPQLLTDYIWFGWIYWINPVAYSFESVLANEFSDRVMECAPSQLVPQGPGIDPAYQGCSLTGAPPNSNTVPGSDYLQVSFNYSRSNLWRNFGVVIAFSVLYLLVTVIATETVSFAASGGGALVFAKNKRAKQAVKEEAPADEEKIAAGESASSSHTAAHEEEEALESISSSESVFTWKDVEYTVPYQGGERKLLNKVNGYAKPGVMIALVGASGAGKSTLLNTLSQRQSTGVVSGEFLVDGKDLGKAFQRGTGFCEQMDLHDGTATIREALEFSAILRQDKSTPRKEKLDYVNKIIDLLELQDIQDALVSSLGVEQKKRLTIGVELAAKPSLLLFLDEPTSGLDSNSAYSIVQFLKKLAQAGQAIVCTIHQPSSVLIQQFDMILALNPGGNTFYFGPVGENGRDVIKYFGDRGVQCPPSKNVAEFILETAAKPVKRKDGSKINWNEEWLNSDNNKQMLQEIDRVKTERSKISDQNQDGGAEESEFAASVWEQTTMLTKRTFIQYWRDPSYLYGKLFVAVIIGIFNGFTFWQLGNSIGDLQNRMFTAFLIILIPPTIVNAVVPKFYQNMALWQARELPSRIYGWVAFTTAQVVAEIPIAIVSSVLYWVLWYFPTGLPTDSSTSGYVFLMTMLFFLFISSWGQWICAFAPSFTVISNVLPFFFVMFGLFNGVVRPYEMMPVFWRYWMYYVNPSTYWIGGVLSATLTGIPVQCQESETAIFDAPPGQSCSSYAGAFASASPGYLLNPEATSGCQYCPYSVGDDYLATINVKASDKWRDFGIFLAFCISNWALVYFFVWSIRIKGWKFGFGMVGNGVGKAKKMLSGKKKGEGKA
ncbi:Brefeldin A resistance protein [Alternaria arborescens]|uniref:ABC multidrug transporter atrF n=1 Tax=Alternaria arborescens TaxID=156630 RepID=A0A4V1X7G7_9PLEO|nr:Brefeldin A resistance protein [Alternaria arborescens]RYN40660.1 Brefeldin A resistance protein [Alternaria arborescens]RYO22682.1 Brefeldin A resistance protein [Alternaria arborescens]RYO69928.1 Brefeldin A resistance protein [Alternaria arborescens]